MCTSLAPSPALHVFSVAACWPFNISRMPSALGALGAAVPQAVVKAGQHAFKSNGILSMTPSVMNSAHLHSSRE